MVIVLAIVFVATFLAVFHFAGSLWLRLDPIVIPILRPATPEESHRLLAFLVGTVTTAICAALVACWLVCRTFDATLRSDAQHPRGR